MFKKKSAGNADKEGKDLKQPAGKGKAKGKKGSNPFLNAAKAKG